LSIKENVQAIKEGLSGEEKIFETAVNLEKYYNKYKLYIWGVLIAVIAYIIVSAVNASNEEERIAKANAAFSTLMAKSDDAKALKALKQSSPNLYDLHRFREAMKASDVKTLKELRNSKAFGIADMATYQYAVLSDDHEALEDYVNDGAIYFKDIAILNVASTYIKQTKLKKAKKLLAQIDAQSPFYEQAQMLMHFGIAK
jgi:hypothetical protein